jgi:uncharacterized protein YndB with AHSA1/START domain
MIDKIEREIFVPVSREKVWRAITQAALIEGWFASQARLDFQVGGELSLTWENGETTRGVILSIDPPHSYSFRWDLKDTMPGDPLQEGNSTVVSFQLEELRDGTRVKVSESGFASLPEDVREAVYQENDHGWRAELEELRVYLAEAET